MASALINSPATQRVVEVGYLQENLIKYLPKKSSFTHELLRMHNWDSSTHAVQTFQSGLKATEPIKNALPFHTQCWEYCFSVDKGDRSLSHTADWDLNLIWPVQLGKRGFIWPAFPFAEGGAAPKFATRSASARRWSHHQLDAKPNEFGKLGGFADRALRRRSPAKVRGEAAGNAAGAEDPQRPLSAAAAAVSPGGAGAGWPGAAVTAPRCRPSERLAALPCAIRPPARPSLPAAGSRGVPHVTALIPTRLRPAAPARRLPRSLLPPPGTGRPFPISLAANGAQRLSWPGLCSVSQSMRELRPQATAPRQKGENTHRLAVLPPFGIIKDCH